MAGRTSWSQLRDRRMDEAGAKEAYESTRLAYELGCTVRELRAKAEWSQATLARAAGMTQSAVARFEAGGTIPTLPVLDRLAHRPWVPTWSSSSPLVRISPDRVRPGRWRVSARFPRSMGRSVRHPVLGSPLCCGWPASHHESSRSRRSCRPRR